METEGETHNSVPNYEIITITFLQIRTIISVFTASGDKWYQWIRSFLSLNTHHPVITKTDLTFIIFIINDMERQRNQQGSIASRTFRLITILSVWTHNSLQFGYSFDLAQFVHLHLQLYLLYVIFFLNRDRSYSLFI